MRCALVSKPIGRSVRAGAHPAQSTRDRRASLLVVNTADTPSRPGLGDHQLSAVPASRDWAVLFIVGNRQPTPPVGPRRSCPAGFFMSSEAKSE